MTADRQGPDPRWRNPHEPGPYGAHGSAAHSPPPPPPAAPAVRPGSVAGPLLVLAVVVMGLLSGLFFTFDFAIMPGLARLDDVAYLTAMHNFDDAINSGPFGVLFVVGLVVLVGAAVVEYWRGRKKAAVWTVVAVGLYCVTLLITFTVNIPLNTELADLGDPAKAGDLSLVDKFKGTWESANIVRTVLCTASVACVAQALKLHGRGTPVVPA